MTPPTGRGAIRATGHTENVEKNSGTSCPFFGFWALLLTTNRKGVTR